MFLSHLFEQKLLELDWYDRNPLVKELENYRGKYIHFTQGIPGRRPAEKHVVPAPEKPTYWSREGARAYDRGVARAERQNATAALPVMKINPTSFHNDPRGIYFYPVDYILSRSEKLRLGQQFASDYKFYFICDIKDDGKGQNLKWTRWEQVEAIAASNGWKDELDRFRTLPREEQAKLLPRYGNPDVPGSVLWHFAERLVRDGKLTWGKAFKGISFIRDPNMAIIHDNEPDQMLVLNPSLIKIVKSGETRTLPQADAEKVDYWRHAVVGIIKQVRGELGGDLVWSKKMPTLSITLGKVSATLAFTSDGQHKPTLTLDYTYGRAKDSISFRAEQFQSRNAGQIVSDITTRLRTVAARKSDLSFKPAISEQDAKRLLVAKVGEGGEHAWTTEITNDQGASYQTMNVVGRCTRTTDGIGLSTRLGASVKASRVSFNTGVRTLAGKVELFNAYNSTYGRGEARTIQDNLDNLFEQVKESMEYHFERVEPKEHEPGAYRNYRERRFQDASTFQAYKGWMVLNSGLGFDGRMEAAHPEQVAAYKAFDDKESLHSTINYILSQFDDRG